jgi:hypothetical protein
MSLDLFKAAPIWTSKDMHLEKDRRLAEDLEALGPRPGWWRPIARGRYIRSTLRLQKAHENDLRSMLATHDPLHRAITAHLIGWKLPTESQ